ncbi:hypothetical protein LOZ61_001205 [Ophidiomyces ophidiicola]|uniref:uncharacterized protein n=1 Tax=Ophidiomyces ophidiicola TaxID=1387563 RepID=UPI0020C2A4FD|nr:uncharacterized protein LOZ57_004865 [Ophidiomyces ophidiicola]KAI1916212.1 hypothetical protein LOZ61_001205 [Ophidiomyces ophidiicola]KAI1929429.1 hypothetical protein LOZ60_001642 [Ophidiomyces ophidiicola]KAI1944506.1 hypothetical protein LOZ57_004865 [Ophidiomyces ophidiicola]KAI2054733.1 hypothetical protein LOZ43_003892 [Ophidiomyces ophidiicola]KAI2101782.1 hypothetical protein LOZ35_000452 [Ophidiomyces ophidiicola]
MASNFFGKGPQNLRYTHTCFLFSPVKFSTGQLPSVFYLSHNNRGKGGSVGRYFLNSRKVVHKELVTTKHMNLGDFDNIMYGALRDVIEGRVDTVSKNEYAANLLREFDPAIASKPPGTLPPPERSLCEVYLIKVESPWPDELWKQKEPGSCIIN